MRRYATVFKWFLHDSIWRFKKSVLLIVLAGFLGVAFQVTAIGQALYYAKLLDAGKTFRLLGLELTPRSSMELLFLVTTGIVLCLLTANGLLYYSRSRAVMLAGRYEIVSSERVFTLLSASHLIWSPREDPLCTEPIILKLATGDARISGRVLRMLLNMFVPAITFIISLAALFLIHVPATLLILSLVGLSGVFLYKINKMGARDSILMETLAPAMRNEKKFLARTIRDISTASSSDHSWIEEPYAAGDSRRVLAAYQGILLIGPYSQLVTGLQATAGILVIFFCLGGSALIHGTGWGMLIIYLVALRYSMSNFESLMRTLTSINRFYPQIRRFHSFCTQTTVSNQSGPTNGDFTLKSPAGVWDGARKEWRLRAGHRLGLLTPVALNRYSLAFLCEGLFPQAKEEARRALKSIWFASANVVCPPIPLRSFLGVNEEFTLKELKAELRQPQLIAKLETQIATDLDAPVDPEMWKQADPDIRFALALVAAIHTRFSWVMLAEKGLAALSTASRNWFLGRLGDRITVIVYSQSCRRVGEYQEDVLAVIGEHGITGLGDPEWGRKHQAAIESYLNKAAKKILGDKSAVEDDDEIDLDE